MRDQTPDFRLDIRGVSGRCPAGDAHAEKQIAEGRTPVLSCEGPCIRGDIARRAADRVAREPSFARACHGESFFVPHSAMAKWVRTADRVVMVDGCFLQCHGRALRSIVPEERIVQIDALPLHKKFCDKFLQGEVPEEERQAVAEEVAGKILEQLGRAPAPACGCGPAKGAPPRAPQPACSSR